MDWNDDTIKRRLNTYESAYSANVFNEVLNGLPTEEKKRPILWLFLGLGMLLLVSLALWNFNSLNGEKSLTRIDTTLTLSNNQMSTQNNEPKEGEVLLPLSNLELNNNNQISEKSIKDEQSSETFGNRDSSQLHDKLTSATVIEDATESDIKEFKDYIQLSKSATTNKPNGAEQKTFTIKSKDYKPTLLSEIPQLPNQISELPFNQNREINEPIGCPFDDARTRRPIFFDIYYSHDMPFRALSSNSTEPQDAYINSRNTSESPIYSYHFGARFSSYLFRDVTLRVGLDYATYQEKFEVSELESTREVIVRDADGNIISTTIEEGLRDVRNFNKIKSLNIPISIGIKRSLGPFDLIAHGGVSMDLISSHSGIILEPGASPNALSYSSTGTSQLDVFKSDLGLSLIGSIGIAKPLSDNLSLIVEPNFKYVLDPINLSSYPVQQRIFTAGLLTGLQYKF